MNADLFQSVLDHEVQPALGCTEPISIALAAAKAVQEIGKTHLIERLHLVVSPGVLKNATGVAVPNTEGIKGCKFAATIGALAGDPDAGLETLKSVTPSDVARALQLLNNDKVTLWCDPSKRALFISVRVWTSDGHGAIATIVGTHTNVHCTAVSKEHGDMEAPKAGEQHPVEHPDTEHDDTAYRQLLGACTLEEMVELARAITDDQRDYILAGVEMNLAIAKAGRQINGYGCTLCDRNPDDTCAIAACATDARMAGMSASVMSSGGSGNQGVVAILVPYLEGMKNNVPLSVILESIALSHLLNAYVKVYLGELAPICGCATGAGIGASAGLVYQANGTLEQIEGAINNVIAMTAGLLCDGAKTGCTLKVISATQATITSVSLAMAGRSAGVKDGITDDSCLQSVRNIARLVKESMTGVDGTIMEIIYDKHR